MSKIDIRAGNVPAFERWCSKILAENKAYVSKIDFQTVLAVTSDGEKVILGKASLHMKSDEDMIQEVMDNPKNVPYTILAQVSE